MRNHNKCKIRNYLVKKVDDNNKKITFAVVLKRFKN